MRSIITMIEEGRECVDIAQQLHAVWEKAVCQAKRTLIQDHIDHRLEDTVSSLHKGERAPLEAFANKSPSISRPDMPNFAELLQQGGTHAWLYFPSAILLGALHGLEPGHSENHDGGVHRGDSGLGQAGGVAGLGGYAIPHCGVAGRDRRHVPGPGVRDAETTEPYFQLASAALIIAIALWML